MAITINNSAIYVNTNVATVFTFSHTVGAGLVNPYLFVSIAGLGSAGSTAGAQFTFTDITFNSVALTEIIQVNQQTSNRGYQLGFWGLASPSVGTYTFSITAVDNNVTGLCVYLANLENVDQITSYGTPVSNIVDADPMTVDISTTRDNSMLFCAFQERGDDNYTYTGITDTTILADLHSNSSSPSSVENQMAVGNRLVTTQTSYTIGINNSANVGPSMVGVEILEAVTTSFVPKIIVF